MATNHQTALASKHATLDRRIAEEFARPQPNDTTIADLKRQKLRIKEELTTP